MNFAKCFKAWTAGCLVSAAFMTAFSSASMAAPLNGTVLLNTALATYFDTDRGFNTKLLSNTVSVTVQAQEALTLTADNHLRRAAVGIASMPHRLTNTGNTTSSFVLVFANRSDDNFDLQSLRLVRDINGNGAADPGEPDIASGSTIGPLVSGAFVDLVITGIIPNAQSSGSAARLDLSARSVAQGAFEANVDSITIADGALLQLFKSATHLAPRAGDNVSFSLTASNTGNRPASGLPTRVDGTDTSLILLRDVIPTNTRFAAFGPQGSIDEGVPLYHLHGQPTHSYTRSTPADLGTVDAVAFGYPANLAPGRSVTRSFEVKVNTNAAGPITNTGQVLYQDGVQPQPMAFDSNAVRMVVPERLPTLTLYSDPQYTRPTSAISAGQVFYVGLDASRCNFDPLLAETKQVSISSALAGDVEIYMARETAPNSGQFQIQPSVPTSDATRAALNRGDGTLSVRANDQLTISVLGCGTTQLQAELLVDPYGVVFDSKTNALLAGAVVSLIDERGAGNGGRPGALARVFMADGVTPSPNVVTTGADGHYQFPLVAPSVYRLQVRPPAPYTFASTLAMSLLPADKVVDAAGSYGGTFEITAMSEPVHIDIPLDADTRAGFLIEKTSSRKTVELGEFVDYQIKIKNVTGQLLGRIRVSDQLPVGFAYLPQSARLDGGMARLNASSLPEPEGGVGPNLVFNVGSLDNNNTLTLTYRLRVGPGALQGDGINRAQAVSAGPLPKLSNESRAVVQVLRGVFTDRGLLMGHVYADCNNNLLRDADEPGIAGVRLVLEDGTNVTTDRQGRYTLYGLRPLTHVLKVDNTSLPFTLGTATGTTWAALSNRHAGAAGSRFVDMKSGDLQRADFAVKTCSADVLRAITERNAVVAQADQNAETARDAGTAALLTKDPRALPVADPKALPASGVVGMTAANRSAPVTAVGGDTTLPKNKPTPSMALSDEAMASLNNQLAFVSPAPDQVLGYAQTSVVVKGLRGATLQLRLNGTLVDASRVGLARSLEAQAVQVVEYVGLNLEAGANVFSVTQTGGALADASSATPQTINLRVIAPGSLARLRITASKQALPADGSTPVKVLIETLDGAGVRVTTPTPVTLQTSRGRWKLRDLDADEPGVQVFVEGGQLSAEFESPSDAGDVLLQASANTLQAQTSLNFVPALRPLLASGIVEGVLNLRRLKNTAVQPARTQDGFEQALQNVGSGFDGGRGTSAARAALYLKGKVLGENLLTLAYDTDKDVRERLFRDIQPNEFYPVYGDDSTPGFDAQSTGRLYLRLERGKSYVLYGDFNTQLETPAAVALDASGKAAGNALDSQRLGNYSRSLNGVRAHLQGDSQGVVEGNTTASSITAFASQTSSRRVVEEVPALGTSGPYAVKSAGFQVNSEKLELLTRDRNQTSVVLRSQTLTRFVDYEIDTLSGGVLLKTPLSSLDANFNPQSLRLTYELESGGRATWVGGVNARVAATDKVILNAGVVRDSDPQHPLILQSAGGTVSLAPGVMLAAEVARTESLSDASNSATAPASAQSGKAARIELRVEAERLKLQAQLVAATAGFDNPSASVTKNQQEATLKASYQLSDKTTFKAEALRSDDLTTSARKDGQQLSVEHALTDKVRGELGVRRHTGVATNAVAVAAGETVTTAQTTLRAKLSAQLPGSDKASAFIEYEQDLDDATRRSAALGGDYQLNSATRLYARYEFISSLGSQYGLNDAQQRNATVFGVQSEYTASANANANLSSEYRIRDALEGRQAEAAVGLRNRWKLGGGWALSTGYERIHSMNALPASNGANNAESLALSGGVEYTGSPLWKGAARLEVRDSPTHSSLLSTVGVSLKLNDEWTALGRNLVTIHAQRNATRKTEDWFQAGLAYRETSREGNAGESSSAPYATNTLMRMEYRTETTLDPLTSISARKVAIVSAHVNQQIDAQLTLSARVAAKWARDESLNLFSSYRTQLLFARAVVDITERWDLGLQTSALLGSAGRSRQLGLGTEVGYLVANNLWLSVGWNVFGFTDRDLSAQDHTQRGAYLRLRFKFDETAF
jgi:large repetitive protein